MEGIRDEHSYLIYTSKQESEKAIQSLKGILFGVSLDSEINSKEINELQKWIVEHQSLMKKNPFTEFMHAINALSNNDISMKEIVEDLHWLCQKYESETDYYYDVITNDLQLLQGICHGILSDGIVNEKEILELKNWLIKNTHLISYYPYDEISTLILDIVSDGKIDEDEKLMVKAYFNEFINLRDDKVKKQIEDDVYNIPISGLCSTEIDVDFKEKRFCITGSLKRCSRKEMQSDIISLGGKIVDTVTENTDYLIVGDNGNQAWVFACYGRKVEKAVNLRKVGHRIKILHEYDFADVIDDLK